MNRKERRTTEKLSRSGKTRRAAPVPIIYLARGPHLTTISTYLESWGSALSGVIHPLAYEELFQREGVPPAIYVFSDIERLPAEMAERAARIWTRLEASLPPGALLNHPTRSMRRFELLRTLHASGANRFNVYRVMEPRQPMRFPVFVRPENEHLHDGQLPVIFHNEGELDTALARLSARGVRQDDLLITEWLETADAAGIHRKYGVFFVAGRVIPRHLFFSRGWVVKQEDLLDPALLAEEREFVTTNPHAAAVSRLFATARIDYGRIDYWIDGDGRLQTWEINTNPSVGLIRTPDRMAVNQAFGRTFNEAILNRARQLAT